MRRFRTVRRQKFAEVCISVFVWMNIGLQCKLQTCEVHKKFVRFSLVENVRRKRPVAFVGVRKT